MTNSQPLMLGLLGAGLTIMATMVLSALDLFGTWGPTWGLYMTHLAVASVLGLVVGGALYGVGLAVGR